MDNEHGHSKPEGCFDPKCDRSTLCKIYKEHDNSTNFFTMNGTQCWGRVVDIYDGDTMKIVLPFSQGLFYKFNCRLKGIDTPELKSRDEKVKKRGLKAKERLVQLVGETETDVAVVWVECLEWDKYGRLLINIYKNPGDESFGDILVREKLAYEYDGGKKKTETEIEGHLTKTGN